MKSGLFFEIELQDWLILPTIYIAWGLGWQITIGFLCFQTGYRSAN